MTDNHTPDAQPISLHDERPTPPTSPPSATPWKIAALVFGAAFLVALTLLATSGQNGVSEDEARNIARTEIAAAGASVGGSANAADADVEQMVAEAVGTQVAALKPTNTPIPPTPTIIPAADVEDDDAFLGPEDAPVVIVEFSDFQCPYCGRWATQTLPQILEAYPDDVKVVYRDFPIFGEESILAAMATECAEDQDPQAFWKMHDRLFERNTDQEQTPLNIDTLTGYADEIGLDTAQFDECLTSDKFRDEVMNDLQAASTYGLRGTPGFVINGVVYAIGAQPFDVFDGIIKGLLNE